MAIVHIANADVPSLQKKIVAKCRYPLFQDTVADDAFGAMGGVKDDLFIYHSDGSLAVKLGVVVDIGDESSPGWQKVKNALLSSH